MTVWPTFHWVLLKKSGIYLVLITLVYLMIVGGFSNVCF